MEKRDTVIEYIGSDHESEHSDENHQHQSDCCDHSARNKGPSLESMLKGAPTSGGPRLGNLKGLSESKKRQDTGNESSKKSIKLLPVILMLVIFGPVILPAFLFAFDKIATSEWGVRYGLSKSIEEQLTDFYKQHNPSKLNSVKSIARKYKGREKELIQSLREKYKRMEKLREEDEKYAS